MTLANVTPDRISITGRGELDRRPLTLDSPAVLTRVEGGWQIAPTRLRFGGGRGTLSGRTGDRPEFRADIEAMPLQLLDVVWPKAGLGRDCQRAGRISLGRPAVGQRQPQGPRPVARRAGAGVEADRRRRQCGARAAAGRRCARSRSATARPSAGRRRASPRIGRGPIVAELVNAPMLLQMRYAGPADTLWRLSGVEVFDLSGPVAIGADISGRLVDPQIRGSLAGQWRADRKRGHRHGGRKDQAERTVQRTAAGAERDQRLDARRRIGQRQRGGRFLRRQGGARPQVRREPGAAARPRRHRRDGDRPARHPLERAGRNDQRQAEAQQRPLHAWPGERRRVGAAAQGAQRRAGRGRGDRARRSPAVEARRRPCRRPQRARAGDRQPLGHRCQHRRVGRRPAVDRAGRPHPRRL